MIGGEVGGGGGVARKESVRIQLLGAWLYVKFFPFFRGVPHRA